MYTIYIVKGATDSRKHPMEKRIESTENGKKILIKLVGGEGWQHVKFEKEGQLPNVKQFDSRSEASRYFETLRHQHARGN